MSNPVVPSNPQSAGNDPSQTGEPGAVAPLSIEEKLHRFWLKNRELVVGFCAIILLGIVAKAGWGYFATQREMNVEQEYAEASTHDRLQAFADAHPDNALAGIAELRLADEAYATHQLTAALAGYEKAIGELKPAVLIGRAKLGAAICKLESGQVPDGAADLKQLADDPKQFQALRAEAVYHLASLAAAMGQADQVRQLSEQLMQIDPTSPWTQRAFALQASLPASATPTAPAGATNGVSFPLQPK